MSLSTFSLFLCPNWLSSPQLALTKSWFCGLHNSDRVCTSPFFLPPVESLLYHSFCLLWGLYLQLFLPPVWSVPHSFCLLWGLHFTTLSASCRVCTSPPFLPPVGSAVCSVVTSCPVGSAVCSVVTSCPVGSAVCSVITSCPVGSAMCSVITSS